MPSGSKTKHASVEKSRSLLWILIGLSAILWLVYRRLFSFPIWLDETIGKAIFFGVPVWLFVTISRMMVVVDTFSLAKMKPGLLMGVAIGGLYGFAASLASLLIRGDSVMAAPLFSTPEFWYEFWLALMTAFFETLFFFSFVMVGIMHTMRKWTLTQQILVTALVFWLFHVPNTIRLLSGSAAVWQLAWLGLFALGQALLFARRQNAYTLVISHAIWGMVLLVHVR